MEIAIIPWSNEYLNNSLFDINDKTLNRDNLLYPYYKLREKFSNKNININTIDYYEDLTEVDYIFFWKLDYKYMLRCISKGWQNKMIYFAWEPEVVVKNHSIENLAFLKKYFKYILTWNDDLINNKNFIKIYNPYELSNEENEYVDFNSKKLMVNISGNKKSSDKKELYSERLKVIKYFEKNNTDEFDLYGIGWNNNEFKNYKGKVEDKINTYKNYKFALSLENMEKVNGYITEKIFDCFKAEIVPIYYGPPNVYDYIPKGCFINYSDFESVDQLVNYIRNISEDEYNKYIYKIREYKQSEEIKVFSTENFINIIYNMIKNDNEEYFTINTIDKIKLLLNVVKYKIFK